MAEGKLDLSEDLIASKPSDQSWIPKGKSLFLNPWRFVAGCYIVYLVGFDCLTRDSALLIY